MTHIEPSPQSAEQPAARTATGWKLFRVRGVPVILDPSWVLMAGFVAFLFYGQLSFALRERGGLVVVGLAAACALLFFASILAHELGHAFASLNRGIPVRSITLFALGGVTESAHEASRPRDEFFIVGIGPFVSLLTAGMFGVIQALMRPVLPEAALVAYLLMWTNLVLAVFNIIPGYPLDGGRLLRSLFWGVTGRPHQATRWAARVGQVVAALFIVLVLYQYTMGGALGSLFNVLIGFFLFRGASDAYRRAQLREQMRAIGIADLMGTAPPTLAETMPLREALQLVQQRPSLLWPVGDPLRGTLLLAQIDAVPEDRWDSTTVAQVALDPRTSSVEVGATLDDVVDLMGASPDNMLVVTDNGRPVGLLTPSLLSRSH